MAHNTAVAYRPEIDGLRALAVLSIILFHAGFTIFGGGYVGVDVFFVISGYLITTIIREELERGKFSISNFYTRRARRIFPALFLVMFLCIPVAWHLLTPSEMKDFSQSLVAASTMISNIFFWKNSGYFETAAELKPLLHTWSLAVEEQYYLLFPLLLILLKRFGRQCSLIVLIIIFSASFALAQWASNVKPNAAFYLLPTRGWELLIGSFTSYVYSPRISQFSVMDRCVYEISSWIGVVLIAYSVFFYTIVPPILSYYRILPTVGAMLIILFATKHTSVGKFLGSKVLVGIGLTSYSAYLWHQPLFTFARIYTFNQVSLYLSAFLIFLTFLLSIISLQYVERPFKSHESFKNGLVFKLSSLGVIFFIIFGVIGHLKGGFLNRFSDDVAIINKAIDDWPYPRPLAQSSTLGFYKFNLNKPIDTLFFGDSHAAQFAPLSSELAKSGINVGFLAIGGCPPIPNLLDYSRPHCAGLIDKLNHVLNVETSIRHVVVAGYFNRYLIDQQQLNPNVDNDNNRNLLQNRGKIDLKKIEDLSQAIISLQNFLQALSLNYKVIVVGDNPAHSFFDPTMLASYKIRGETDFFRRRYPNFDLNGFPPATEQVVLNQRIQLSLLPNISFINSLEIICPNNKCKPLDKNGNPLYKDSNHVRPGFIRDTFSTHIIGALITL